MRLSFLSSLWLKSSAAEKHFKGTRDGEKNRCLSNRSGWKCKKQSFCSLWLCVLLHVSDVNVHFGLLSLSQALGENRGRCCFSVFCSGRFLAHCCTKQLRSLRAFVSLCGRRPKTITGPVWRRKTFTYKYPKDGKNEEEEEEEEGKTLEKPNQIQSWLKSPFTKTRKVPKCFSTSHKTQHIMDRREEILSDDTGTDTMVKDFQ